MKRYYFVTFKTDRQTVSELFICSNDEQIADIVQIIADVKNKRDPFYSFDPDNYGKKSPLTIISIILINT